MAESIGQQETARALDSFYRSSYQKAYEQALKHAAKNKLHAGPGFFKTIAGKSLAGGLGLGTALAIAGLYSKLTGPSEKKGFKGLLKNEPQFNADADKVKKIYKTLYNLNPELANDPLIAGAWIRRALELGDVAYDPRVLKDLMPKPREEAIKAYSTIFSKFDIDKL